MYDLFSYLVKPMKTELVYNEMLPKKKKKTMVPVK